MMFFRPNKRRKITNQKRQNYSFRSRKKKDQAPAEVHILHYNPETDASLREKRRDRHRREFKIAVALIGLMAVLALVRVVVKEAFMENPKFRLQRFSVLTDNPNGALSVPDIVAATGLHQGDNMLMVSLRSVKERLETLPEVRHATVTRQYPGVLALQIEMRRPIAVLQSGEQSSLAAKGGYRCLLDEDGQILEEDRYRDWSGKLPLIAVDQSLRLVPGSAPDSVLVELAMKLLKLHQGSPLAEAMSIVRIDAAGKVALQVTYSRGGLTVKFPTYDLEKQMHRLAALVRSADELHRTLGSVNLLVEQNVPVVYHPEQAPAHPTPATRHVVADAE